MTLFYYRGVFSSKLNLLKFGLDISSFGINKSKLNESTQSFASTNEIAWYENFGYQAFYSPKKHIKLLYSKLRWVPIKPNQNNQHIEIQLRCKKISTSILFFMLSKNEFPFPMGVEYDWLLFLEIWTVYVHLRDPVQHVWKHTKVLNLYEIQPMTSVQAFLRGGW